MAGDEGRLERHVPRHPCFGGVDDDRKTEAGVLNTTQVISNGPTAALVETIYDLCKAEVIHRSGRWRMEQPLKTGPFEAGVFG